MTTETKFGQRFQGSSRSYNYDAAAALVVNIAATSTASAAVISAGEYRMVATSNCWITEAASPTAAVATAGNMYLPANVPVFIQFGGATKIATIRDTADGKLSLVKTD